MTAAALAMAIRASGEDRESYGTVGDAYGLGSEIGLPIEDDPDQSVPAPLAVPWKSWSGTWADGGGFIEATAVGAGTPNAVAEYGTFNLADIDLRCVLSSNPGRHGLWFRGTWDVVFGLSGYVLRFQTSTELRLVRVDAGVATQLASVAISAAGIGGSFWFLGFGKNLWGYINGVKVIAATDLTYTSGGFGICANLVNARFGRFVVAVGGGTG